MGLFFIHIIKSSLCLIAFYLAYKVFLSKETFYKGNRIILLTIILASITLPFLQLTIQEPVVNAVSGRLSGIENLLQKKEVYLHALSSNTEDSFYFLLFIVYILGVLVQLVITGVNFIKLYKLIYQAEHFPYQHYILAITKHDQAAFSWGKYIVLSQRDYENNPEIIIRHELVHLDKRHFYDLLLAELAIFIFWFNPVMWLLKTELKNIHEFEVDDTLLKQGVDAKQYQLLLIKKAVGANVYSMVNTFSQSKLTTRIRMMLRQKSSPWAKLKYLSIIVLTLFSILAFSHPGVKDKLKKISSDNLEGFIKEKVNAVSDQITGNDEDLRVAKTIKNSDQLKNGAQTEALQNNSGTLEKKHVPLCLVNGKETSYQEFQEINSQFIKTVQVLKEEEGLAAYGDKGKYGVIVMTLQPEQAHITKTYNEGIAIDSATLVVFFVNGKPLGDKEQALFNNQLGSFTNADMVENVVPLKGKIATEKYGAKGSNGVVEIYLKNK